MQDTALYQYLLDLQSPWAVSRVTLDVTGQRVDVWAEHADAVAWSCPHCSQVLPVYDHADLTDQLGRGMGGDAAGGHTRANP